jgi:hypothetical protein
MCFEGEVFDMNLNSNTSVFLDRTGIFVDRTGIFVDRTGKMPILRYISLILHRINLVR